MEQQPSTSKPVKRKTEQTRRDSKTKSVSKREQLPSDVAQSPAAERGGKKSSLQSEPKPSTSRSVKRRILKTAKKSQSKISNSPHQAPPATLESEKDAERESQEHAQMVSSLGFDPADLYEPETSTSLLGMSETLFPEVTIESHVQETDIRWEVVVQSYGMSVIKIIGTKASSQSFNKFEYLLILPKGHSEEEVQKMKINFDSNKYSAINLYCGFCNDRFSDLNESFPSLFEKLKLSGRTGFRCNICNRVHQSRERFHKDLFQHISEKDLFCGKCKQAKSSLRITDEDQPQVSLGQEGEEKCTLTEMWKRCLYRKLTMVHCRNCRTVISNGNSLKEKLLEEVAKKENDHRYKCNICEEMTAERRARAELHVLNHFTSQNVFCSECLLRSTVKTRYVPTDQSSTSVQQGKILNKSSPVYVALDAASRREKVNWVDHGEYRIIHPGTSRHCVLYRCRKCETELGHEFDAMKKHISKEHQN